MIGQEGMIRRKDYWMGGDYQMGGDHLMGGDYWLYFTMANALKI